MAIIENRVKKISLLPDLLFLIKSTFGKFLSSGLLLISLLLWYLSSNSQVNKVIFDFNMSFIINPVVSTIDSIFYNIEQINKSIRELWYLKQENIILKLENARLNKLIMESSHIYAENLHLKKALKLSEDFLPKAKISGRVLTISNELFQKTAVVNLGINNGIRENQVALAEGVIIGKVTQLSYNYSIITLVSDIQSRIPIISSISGNRAIFAGDGSNSGELLYVPENVKMKIGEILYSSGDGLYYPAGIPVAKITRIEGSHIYAESIINLSNIKFVTMLE